MMRQIYDEEGRRYGEEEEPCSIRISSQDVHGGTNIDIIHHVAD